MNIETKIRSFIKEEEFTQAFENYKQNWKELTKV